MAEPMNQDHVYAEKIQSALRRNNRRCRGSVVTSAEGLRLLREVDNQDYAAVVDAYCDCCDLATQTRLGLPLVENGHQVRKHWEWLLTALVKAGKLSPEGKRVSQVADAAKRVVKRLDVDLLWPKGSSTQLPLVVQASLDNYRSYRKRYLSVKNGLAPGSLKRLADELLVKLPRAEEFVEDWFRDLHERYANWDNWSGKLAAWHEDCDRFQQQGAEWADDYCGDVSRWTALARMIKEEST